MDNNFHFLDLPHEIQELILWKCLEGWKATVEVHEKGDKITARLFSSVIYDALMLSLTCKSIHDVIQRIQSDPRLFNGEIDMIEANAQLPYLVGVFTDPAYLGLVNTKPVPLYRTQIFIKNQPYDRNSQNWRMERMQYHANVRNWLMQNTTSLGVWADEITPHVPWAMFPKLKDVTMYWPHTAFRSKHPDLYLCEHSNEDFMDMAQGSWNTDGSGQVEMIKPLVEHVTKRGMTVTLYLETSHAHARGESVSTDLDASLGFEMHNLGCRVRVQGTEWKVDHIVCDA